MAEYGKKAEDMAERICTEIFFSDFTVRNPKYKKASGAEKEAADILIPFRDTLIVFQVKSKLEMKDAISKNKIDFARIEKKIQEGIGQFKAIKEAINGNLIEKLVTVRGIEIPFRCSQFKKIIGVVILDLAGEEKHPRDKRTSVLNGFTIENDIPIHIFMRDDFEEIAKELDTMPDFLRYINIRETLKKKNALSMFSDELDFLAIFKTRWPIIEDLLNGKHDLLSITGGIWDSYQKQTEVINARNRKNRPSYLVDEIISWLYESIGFNLYEEIPEIKRSRYPQGSVDNYMQSITELASIERIRRRDIGEAMLEKAEKAKGCGMGYRLLTYPKEQEAILVLSFDGNRKDRVERLYTLCSIGYCKENLKKIIGIATEPAESKLRSYDITVLDGVEFSNKEDILKSQDKLFGSRREGKTSEY